jgi:hypothetical protein
MKSLEVMMLSVTEGFSLMKFELMRDFFQILNLYIAGFVSADAYKGVMAFFGSLGGIISLDVSFFDVTFDLNLGLSQY